MGQGLFLRCLYRHSSFKPWPGEVTCGKSISSKQPKSGVGNFESDYLIACPKISHVFATFLRSPTSPRTERGHGGGNLQQVKMPPFAPASPGYERRMAP